MRIIHTSDWHLGQNFMGKSRVAEHQAFLSWLLDQVKTESIDAIIVAGDIFDTGSPPSYAREMYNRFIVDVHASSCQLIILAGNHDSVATLNESKDLLACLNTHVISTVAVPEAPKNDNDNTTGLVFPLKNRHNEIVAILCAIPFIRQRDVLISQAGQSGQEKQQAMQQAIANLYQQQYQQAVKLRKHYAKQQTKKSKSKLPIIATGHLTTVGASTSDSVRDIYIGTLDAFPAKAFPPVDYLALGHIHQTQKVAKSEHIRYSGSPIALSFDENCQKKSVLLVEFKEGKFKQAKPLKIPSFQAMATIKGNLKQIEKQLNELAETTLFNETQTIWVEIIVSSQDYLNDLQNRIQVITEKLPIEVLRIRRERKNQSSSLQREEKETLNELTVMDVFERRLSEEIWTDEKQTTENSDQQNQHSGQNQVNNSKRLKRIKQNFHQILDELKA